MISTHRFESVASYKYAIGEIAESADLFVSKTGWLGLSQVPIWIPYRALVRCTELTNNSNSEPRRSIV